MPAAEVTTLKYRRPRRALIAVLAAMSIAGTSMALLPPNQVSALAAGPERHDNAASPAPRPLPKGLKRLCPAPARGRFSCDAVGFTTKRRFAAPRASVMQPPYGPSALRFAYNLSYSSTAKGGGQTVAIVDSNDYPNLESDLATYRSQYGLPACTTANGCFRKVNQSGAQSNYPAYDGGWGGEEVLDVDMVSAICPNCHIIVVEANSPTANDLNAAEDTAIELGAKFISNSWGGTSSVSGTAGNGPWDSHPGVVVTASSGDSGYGVEYPAAYTDVVGVGGTSLLPAANARGWDEIAWGNAGSGCSSEPKPRWQTDTGCSGKTIADVSAVADPSTGVMIYDSDPNGPTLGWGQIGGTSASSPIVAATFALAGPLTTSDAAPLLWRHPSSLYDIVAGTNSPDGCTPTYLCTAQPGFDGPTGWGTPDNVDAFTGITGTTNTYSHKPDPGTQADVVNAQGGPVMKNVVVYLDFWLPPGYSYRGANPDPSGDQAFESQQERFIKDLSGSAYWNMLSQYGVPSTVTLGGVVVDTRPYPAVPLPVDAPAAEAGYIDSHQHWPVDLGHVTLVLPGYNISDVKSACGYHGTEGVVPAGAFGFIPDFPGCAIHLPNTNTPLPSPNNPADDEVTGVIAHELAESATDPLLNAWIAPSGPGGREIGDLCAVDYPTGPWNDQAADMDLNGDHYLVQQLWSNAVKTCDMGLSGNGTPAPYVSLTQSVDNASPAPGTTVHITLTLTNSDPAGAATNLDLQETLPPNFTITNVATAGDAAHGSNGTSFYLNYAALAIEQTVTVTVTAVAQAGPTATVCPSSLTLDDLVGKSVAPATTDCVTL